jgi:hypothetical protein
MSSHYEDQERAANEFAKLSGLPFVYIYTGGGCDAIYGETIGKRVYITNDATEVIKHRIYITDDASVPSPDDVHYVGIYSDNDDLVGECWAANRGELLESFSKFSTLDELVEFIIGDGFNGFANVGAL